MKKVLFFLLCSAYFLNSQAQKISENPYTAIGKIYQKIDEIAVFKKYKVLDELVITDSKEYKNSFTKISDGNQTIVLFTEYGLTGNKILAILNLEKLEKNILVLMRECRVNLKTDGFIVALVNQNPQKKYFTKIIKAWRLNQKTNSFSPIPIKGIDCLNEEFENEN